MSYTSEVKQLNLSCAFLLLALCSASGCKPTPHPTQSTLVECPATGCKEVAEDLKINHPINGLSGVNLKPSEIASLKKALSAGPVDHIDIKQDTGGDLAFEPETNPGHSNGNITHMVIRNNPSGAPDEVKIAATPEAAAAMRQRASALQK
jgi:hypothetical protein